MRARSVEPIGHPLDTTVSVPGSKSITNRALLIAALADGSSTLHGVLDADDTAAMIDCLGRLGVELSISGTDVTVSGCAGNWPASSAELDARQSGTTARFLMPALCGGRGRFRLDGAPQLRRRPLADQVEALGRLGAKIEYLAEPGELPVEVWAHGLDGGEVALAADVSSQFASGLLIAGPAMTDGLRLTLTGDVVSRPYLDLTVGMMRASGATVGTPDAATYAVAPGRYRAGPYHVEPDASAASYFFAAAAICRGRVTVQGLGAGSAQGDIRFVDVLEAMGATVDRRPDSMTVTVDRPLRGIKVDLSDLSDTAPTLAVVAPFATGATRITGIGFIRAKESDRIAATVTELRRCGIAADEEVDGLVVHPGRPHRAVVHTYNDHRIAMSFALLGLVGPGIEIADPDCVAKTFPGYWGALAGLARGAE